MQENTKLTKPVVYKFTLEKRVTRGWLQEIAGAGSPALNGAVVPSFVLKSACSLC